jgi:hypothetical protein
MVRAPNRESLDAPKWVSMSTQGQLAPEFAFYHPWPPIHGRTLGEWVKTMLLFFEGVAILAPSAEAERLVTREEEILAPLADLGLFRVLDPRDLIQKHEAEAILEFLFVLAASVEAEGIRYRRDAWPEDTALSRAVDRGGLVYRSRGVIFDHGQAHQQIATILWDTLQRYGVATPPDSCGDIYMHPTFWAVYLAFLAHSLYDAGLRMGLSLRPATDQVALINTQNAILDIPGYPSSGHVIGFDLQQVTLDLSHFELSEVLQFREEHGAEYRRYARNLREFAMAASRAKGNERRRLMQDRHDALADEADDLRRTSRDWWRRAAASIGIGISGGAWSAFSGDWPAAIIAILGGVAGTGAKPQLDSAFSYLFRAEQSFTGR